MKGNGFNLKIILLAAGKSERFNGIKLLAKVQQQSDSITLIQHVLQQISKALNILNIDESNLHVATGGYHPQLEQLIANQYSLSYCENAHSGLGHTIAQSVEKTLKNEDNISHIMITLADQVALNSDDYVNLIKQSFATPDKLICAKVGQEIMPPAIFPYDYFTDLMTLKGDKGAKALLHVNKENLKQVLLSNAAVDIDTEDDLINWRKSNI